MDIKDFILIGGGLLIAAVIAHGFWIAWRGRQQTLRIDIQPDLIPDVIDDMERLRGELPHGGARLVGSADPEQTPLPLTLEPPQGPPEGIGTRQQPAMDATGREEPAREVTLEFPTPGTQIDRRTEPSLTEPTLTGDSRSKVAEVEMPEPALVTEKPPAAAEKPTRRLAQRRASERKNAERAVEKPAPTEELIVMNVIAPAGSTYGGEAIFDVLGGKGLKFGDMNIFHRSEPLTRAIHYSIANVVEPGTFDMADMEAFHTPGLCFFMQLPGPEHPIDAFEDMLDVAREVAARLGGEISDEQRNRMTPQTVEHYRQRIADFSRRRMSKRA